MTDNNEKIILIIDDNPMNLLLTSKILEGFGYQTRTSESGQEGIEQIEREIPSLILLDISMPDMDGYEVCEEIKKNEKWAEIPIIFLTANTLTEDLVKGFQKGGVDYITKPFKSEELHVRVKTHLDLFDSKNEVLKMNKQRDKLYSIIAHDIRSPLSGILQTVDAIEQGYFDPTSEDFKEIIHHLKERTKETSTLLTSLLQWSRVKSDKFEMHPTESNVYVIVSSCIQLLNANAENKNISIHFDSDENAIAWCDEVSIHTVIRNLISNAIKFTNSNGTIWVRTKRSDCKLRIEIIDSGVGMAEETIKKIFEQNEHYTSTGTNNEQGTGLGLMIVKEFVEKNNGAIKVESVIGKGSTFVIELPIEKNC
jgi:two-component system sensor histidine kinase/response regulator